MNTSILDKWLPASIIQTRLPESFGWDPNDVLFLAIPGLELWLDSVFPFSLHDLLNSSLAQVVPFPTKPSFAHSLECFVNEDASTKTT